MKKLSLLFVSIYLSLTNLSAQEIVCTFNPKDASNTIDSIRATNVVTGETAFADGLNSINISSLTTEAALFPTNPVEISVYPNPFENYTRLKYYSNKNDNIKITIVNAAGQVVSENSQNIASGIHQFNISTNNNGLYILNITGNQTKFSQKIISIQNNQSVNKIEYNGYSSMSPLEKSTKIEGDELIHFYVYSGDNITKIADSPTESKNYEVEFYECKDADGKSYPIVQIGDQWWTAENLAYLPNVSPPTEESYSEKYYYVYEYNGTNIAEAKATENYRKFGVLYNWSAIMNGESGNNLNPSGVQGICPNGWHLPSDSEWDELAQFISNLKGPFNKEEGGDWEEVGKYLKATNDWNNEGNGTDDFGFSGLPGGFRYTEGFFYYIGEAGGWWTSTDIDATGVEDIVLSNEYNSLFMDGHFKEIGFSVRCIKD